MKNLKLALRTMFPVAYGFGKKAYYSATMALFNRTRQHLIFTKIYRMNAWGDADTVSGGGSTMANTETIRRELPRLARDLHIQSFLDIPCGDFFWMRETNLDVQKYIGADIVVPLIESNQKMYQNKKREFVVLDILNDALPPVDVIFCRDCLPHFSVRDIWRALKRIVESKSRFLLTSSYTNLRANTDVDTGGFRPLNLQREPFSFPPPLTIINDACSHPTGTFPDKSLGLWKISELPVVR